MSREQESLASMTKSIASVLCLAYSMSRSDGELSLKIVWEVCPCRTCRAVGSARGGRLISPSIADEHGADDPLISCVSLGFDGKSEMEGCSRALIGSGPHSSSVGLHDRAGNMPSVSA